MSCHVIEGFRLVGGDVSESIREFTKGVRQRGVWQFICCCYSIIPRPPLCELPKYVCLRVLCQSKGHDEGHVPSSISNKCIHLRSRMYKLYNICRLCIYTCMCVYIYIYRERDVYIYIYIYRERERVS